MSIRQTMMGVETEYAIAPRGRVRGSDAAWGREEGTAIELRTRARADAAVEGVCKRLAHIRAVRVGYHVKTGGKYYRDRHLEHASAEAADPVEACAQILGGDQLLAEVVRDRKFGGGGIAMRNLALFNINLDYGEECSSWWASHENISTCGPLLRTKKALAPHLATRVIYTGAGGFDPQSPLRFILSPRAILMTRGGILAHEPFFLDRINGYGGHDGGAARIHLACGESLRSHRALYLRLATTALVTNLADQGIVLDRAFHPVSPGGALRTFAGDVALSATVQCDGDEMRSAIEIQHAILDMVIAAHAAGKLPEWAGQVIPIWQGSLMSLATGGHRKVERSIEWAIKHAVFESHAARRGIDFAQLAAWNDLLALLSKKSTQFSMAMAEPLGARGTLTRPIEIEVHEHLKRQNSPLVGTWWEQLPLVLAVRLELRELDWRYHEIGSGIFDKLDAQGLLQHHVPGLTPERIEHAMTHAPADTRAQRRGEIIARMHGTPRGEVAQCDWDQIIDAVGHRVLYLNHDDDDAPPRWKPFSMTPDGLLQRLNVAIAQYRGSDFANSARELVRLRLRQMCDRRDPTVEQTTLFRTYRYSAWVSARLGLPAFKEYLRRIHRDGVDARTYFKVADHLYCLRFLGIRPHRDMDAWIPLADGLLKRRPHHDEPIHASLLEHMGAWHLFRGELDEAHARLKDVATQEQCLWRRVRMRCLMSDLWRRRGSAVRAKNWLDEAQSGTGDGDPLLVAEQITPTRAKQIGDANERAEILDNAAELLRDARHRVALARVLVLRARGLGDGVTAREVVEELRCLRRRTPGLRQCELMTRVMNRWEEWVGDERATDEGGDRFWGV